MAFTESYVCLKHRVRSALLLLRPAHPAPVHGDQVLDLQVQDVRIVSWRGKGRGPFQLRADHHDFLFSSKRRNFAVNQGTSGLRNIIILSLN